MINRIARKIYNNYRLSIIAKRVFDAALTDQQKSLVDEYTNKRQQGLSFGPMFSSDRTYFNIGKLSLSVIETPQQIKDILDSKGYYCPDYREGYVYKKDDKLKNKPVKLIKVLRKCVSDNQQFNILKKMFDQRLDTSRKQMKSCLICITHNPYDVAGMSTDRSWTSCMELPGIKNPKGGAFYNTVLKQVQYGGMCAYLIENDDKQIQRPLARTAIKRLVGANGEFIFIAQETIYGEWGFARQLNFVKQVQKILEESNQQTMNNEKIFIKDDDDSYTDSEIYKKYMFKDNDDLIQYFKQNINNCIKNEEFIESLTMDQLHSLFPYFIKDIDINYKEKMRYLYKLIDNGKLTEKQMNLVIDLFIKKQYTNNLCQLIKENRLTEEQKKSVIDFIFSKQDTKNLYWLIKKDKLTEEQKKLAIDFIFSKQDTQNLFDLIYHNKLTEEQKKSAIDIIFKKQDIKSLYWLISDDELAEEQKKLAINIFIKKQDTYYLYWLIVRNKLTEEQKKLAIDIMIKKQDTQHLYQFIKENKLIEEQKKSAIDIMFKKQDTHHLSQLIKYDELTEEQRKRAINILIKKQDTQGYLTYLIYCNKLTEQQINQFNLSYLIQG